VCGVIAAEVQTVITIPNDFDLESLLGQAPLKFALLKFLCDASNFLSVTQVPQEHLKDRKSLFVSLWQILVLFET